MRLDLRRRGAGAVEAVMLTRSEECRQKREAVVRYLEAHDLEGVVLSRRPNFAWFTCGGLHHVSTATEVGAASLLVTPRRSVCIANNIEAPRLAAEELAGLGIEVCSFDWWDEAAAKRVWSEELGALQVACDAPVSAAGGRLRPLPADFDLLRRRLNEAEIARYRRLAPEVAAVVETACRQVRPGMTEHELAARMAAGLRARGIRAPVILAANEERVRRFRHPLPTQAVFSRYGMGAVCAEREGLYVSVTRLFSFGPVDEALRRRHEAVCKVDAAMMAATVAGAMLGDVFTACQRAYAEAGFPDEWKHHHQGGQVGYLPRETRATPGCAIPVSAGQAFGWNPTIAGTKSEDTILVSADRTEILSATGDWPTRPYCVAGLTFARNEILEL
ncbi:MAG: aminopeptidase P family protein [Phycisphaerae bacterium]